MNIFLTGASGYIGGSVATELIAAGHRVRGLVRSDDKAAAVRAFGITPVPGTLDDLDALARLIEAKKKTRALTRSKRKKEKR